MTLSSDDQDDTYAVCPECGRPLSTRVDLVAGLVWLGLAVLASVAMIFVIAYCMSVIW